MTFDCYYFDSDTDEIIQRSGIIFTEPTRDSLKGQSLCEGTDSSNRGKKRRKNPNKY